MSLILHGLKLYLRRKSDIPSPHDILAIIDQPKPKFVPDRAVYVGIKQRLKDPYAFVSDREREYLWKCEQHAIRGDSDEWDSYEEAQEMLRSQESDEGDY